MTKQNDKLQRDIDRVVKEYKLERKVDPNLPENQVRFDAMIWKMVTTSKKDLDKHIAAKKLKIKSS